MRNSAERGFLNIAKILLLMRNLSQHPVGDCGTCKVYYAYDVLVSQRGIAQS